MWSYNYSYDYADEDLMHYGVKGMKWGVRKEVYNSSSRSRKKEIRKEYYRTPEGRIKKATTIGTVLGGPLAGIVAGSITAKKIEKEVGAIKHNKLSSVDNKVIEKGRKEAEALLTGLKSGKIKPVFETPDPVVTPNPVQPVYQVTNTPVDDEREIQTHDYILELSTTAQSHLRPSHEY